MADFNDGTIIDDKLDVPDDNGGADDQQQQDQGQQDQGDQQAKDDGEQQQQGDDWRSRLAGGDQKLLGGRGR